ncbi:hypothetical protein DIPPA_08052 [Diplonema papillatum]|nr:hypothetical protein DIPPA_08052 [Diplonema papillatum]
MNKMIAQEAVSRWSIVMTFLSTFLVAHGLLLHHLVHRHAQHQLFWYSLWMCFVGLAGIFATVAKKIWLVKTQMLLTTFLMGATCRLVLARCAEESVACPVAVTSIQASQQTIFMETMPGLYVEVGSQVHYVVQTVILDSTDCTSSADHAIRRIWAHIIFLLFTILISSLLACWRFLVALLVADSEYVLLSICECEEEADKFEEDPELYDVFTSVKEVPMPPPVFSDYEADTALMATLTLPSFPDAPSTFPAPKVAPKF